MCEYCQKFAQKAYELKDGLDIDRHNAGEVFIDFTGDLIVHIEGQDDFHAEACIDIKYCPWCGGKLKKLTRCLECKYNIGSRYCPACRYNYRECATQGCCWEGERDECAN